MVIDDINAKGGLLGRQVDLYLEDSATTDSVAEAKATKLVQQDQVDVIFGGIYSSTRQAIKGPAVVKGKKLYIYPEQYEGQECDPLIFCTGPVPAQQVDPSHPLADATDRGEEVLLAVGRLHLAAHDEQEGPSSRHGQRWHDRRRGVLPPRSRRLWQDRRQDHVQRRGGGIQHDRSSRARAIPRAALQRRLHEARWTPGLHVLRGELPELLAGRTRGGASTAASTTTRPSAIRSARSCSIGTTSSIRAVPSSLPAVRVRACTEV